MMCKKKLEHMNGIDPLFLYSISNSHNLVSCEMCVRPSSKWSQGNACECRHTIVRVLCIDKNAYIVQALRSFIKVRL